PKYALEVLGELSQLYTITGRSDEALKVQTWINGSQDISLHLGQLVQRRDSEAAGELEPPNGGNDLSKIDVDSMVRFSFFQDVYASSKFTSHSTETSKFSMQMKNIFMLRPYWIHSAK